MNASFVIWCDFGAKPGAPFPTYLTVYCQAPIGNILFPGYVYPDGECTISLKVGH